MIGSYREYLVELERERELLIKQINRLQSRLSELNSEIGSTQRALLTPDKPLSREGRND